MDPKKLLTNIRFYVLCFSVFLSAAIFVWVNITFDEGSIRTVKLVETYALTAITYLYFTLLAGPFTYTFRFFPWRSQYIRARRGLGVSTYYFALLHANFAFFGLLGGFPGLFYLDNRYLFAISLSFTALVILTLMAATSFDFMVAKLRARWKLLHRFVYLAATLITIHALLLGSHFSDLSTLIPHVAFFALAFLLLLEAPRVDKLIGRFVPLPSFGFTFVLVATALGILYVSFVNPIFGKIGKTSLSIHNAHIQLAQQIQSNSLSLNIPGLQGDRTKRYTASFLHPENVKPNQPITLRFPVYNASSGEQIQLFRTLYEKTSHLIVVNSSLEYFDHVHPTMDEKGFTITYTFPKDDIYHLYLDFQPWEGIEQQMAFTLNVGKIEKPVFSQVQPDQNLTKSFGNYQVALTKPDLVASKMSLGQQKLKFTISDNSTKKAVANLKPYLSAFGHLVMINQKTFDYLHVHPANLTPAAANANGGPDVEFLPIGIYGAFKPGIYRAFAQFNPDGKLFTADFTLEVK